MTWAQAAAYFLKAAIVSLLRGWRTSLLAVMTIAVSLFLTGVFLLLSLNLQSVVAGWRAESRLAVYLEEDASETDLGRVTELIRAQPWVVAAQPVTGQAARERFVRAFPSMADLLEGFDRSPLPPSVEVVVDWGSIGEDADKQRALVAAIETWRADSAVESIDDDRDWLDQLEAVTVVLRGLATVIAVILITTAIFTIASVIRLAAHQHSDEIDVLRLVGATEFFIRGPFYAEGSIQGALGGGVAVAALGAGFFILRQRIGDGLLGSLVTGRFLGPSWLVGLVLLGALAGLIGAIVSLGRERADGDQQAAPWSADT